MNQTDPARIADACGMYAGAALLFSFSGVSFSVSRRILDVARSLMRAGNVKDELTYRAMRFLHHYLEGDWDEAHAIEESLVDESLRYGALWDVNMYLGLECERTIHQGDFAAAGRIMAKLGDVVDAYGLDFARANREFMVALLALQRRDLTTAVAALDRYESGRHEMLLHLLALGTRAKIDLLTGDRAAAAATLVAADALARGQVPPYFRTMTAVSRLIHDLGELEAEPTPRAARRRALERRAERSARTALIVYSSGVFTFWKAADWLRKSSESKMVFSTFQVWPLGELVSQANMQRCTKSASGERLPAA